MRPMCPRTALLPSPPPQRELLRRSRAGRGAKKKKEDRSEPLPMRAGQAPASTPSDDVKKKKTLSLLLSAFCCRGFGRRILRFVEPSRSHPPCARQQRRKGGAEAVGGAGSASAMDDLLNAFASISTNDHEQLAEQFR